jgi:hypothetical protein
MYKVTVLKYNGIVEKVLEVEDYSLAVAYAKEQLRLRGIHTLRAAWISEGQEVIGMYACEVTKVAAE